MWLISSNANNNAWYHSLGFDVAEQWLLGENNPRWQHKPVVLTLVSVCSIHYACDTTLTNITKMIRGPTVEV
jgi:hypothetical protein